MSKAKKIDALVAERRKLFAQWRANRRAQIKLQHQLDQATTELAKVVGLEALLEFSP
jgi:hypothetical protein